MKLRKLVVCIELLWQRAVGGGGGGGGGGEEAAKDDALKVITLIRTNNTGPITHVMVLIVIICIVHIPLTIAFVC